MRTLSENLLPVFLIGLAALALAIHFCIERAMRRAAISNPPTAHFLVIFSGSAALLVSMALLSFADPHSANPSASWLGAAIFVCGLFPVFLAPLAILINSYFLLRQLGQSGFHRGAFLLGLLYFVFLASFFVATP